MKTTIKLLLIGALLISAYANSSYHQSRFSNFEQLMPNLEHYIKSFDSKFNQFRHKNTFTNSPKVWQYIDKQQNAYVVQVNLDNMTKDDIVIKVVDNQLNIQSQTNKQTKTNNKYSEQSSYQSSNFYQSFSLPKDIDQDKIEAKFKHSILKIILPRQDNVKPNVRQIKIN